MEKRLPIALFLSFLVLMTWNILSPRPEPPEEDAAVTQEAQADARLEGYAEAQPGAAEGRRSAEREEEIPLTLGRPGAPGAMELVFSNRGARLLSLRLADYFSTQDRAAGEGGGDGPHWVELLSSVQARGGATGSLGLRASESAKQLLTEPLEDALWQHRLLEDGSGIEFSYAPGNGLVFTKRLVRGRGEHGLTLTLGVRNEGAQGAAGLRQFLFTPAEVVKPTGDSRFYQEPQTLAAWITDEGAIELETAVQKTGGKDLGGSLPKAANSRLSFAGVHNKFFALLARPATKQQANGVIGVSYRRVQDRGWLAEHPEEKEGEAWKYVVCDLALQVPVPEVGGSAEVDFELYAGPKQRGELEAFEPAFGELLDEDIGMFSGIAKIITAILSFYQGLVGNWGFAIILMTLTVRALLFPLNRRAQTAMARFAKKMKRVQPMVDATKEKYADDPKKQREEQAKIMQREGAFPPLGGCLPLFLQFPVFIGLFQALRVHFDLRHEPFVLWMKDLSSPDQLARIDLNTHLPFIGTIEYLNILPLLMIVLWIVQHKVMPQPTASNDPKVAQQRKLMIGMQVFFALLFYNYASGLALYMITSSSVAIFESLVIKRVWPIDDSEQEKKQPGRFMQKFKELQAQQQRLLEQQEQARRAGGAKKGKGGAKGKKR